mmetsp:Transcript_47450/g.85407  ORF Transcript_47450/g.85407 Transcript_47450/m.85407 type:complete len:223 (-) Transcript_47450:3058-3726(-)
MILLFQAQGFWLSIVVAFCKLSGGKSAELHACRTLHDDKEDYFILALDQLVLPRKLHLYYLAEAVPEVFTKLCKERHLLNNIPVREICKFLSHVSSHDLQNSVLLPRIGHQQRLQIRAAERLCIHHLLGLDGHGLLHHDTEHCQLTECFSLLYLAYHVLLLHAGSDALRDDVHVTGLGALGEDDLLREEDFPLQHLAKICQEVRRTVFEPGLLRVDVLILDA